MDGEYNWGMENDAIHIDTKLSARQIVDWLLEKAGELNVSDIHIDPKKDSVAISMRTDGILDHTLSLSKSIYSELIACIKISSGLRTDLHTLSQDGRFETTIDSTSYVVRVSIVNTFYGENAVLRLLKRGEEIPTLSELGFDSHEIQSIEEILQKRSGLILITGPTGSGKSSTLHSLLRLVSGRGRNIITVEDPVEYILPEAKQIQINEERGVQFSSVLKSILRQDPNIIMLGEIRDKETAEFALNSALTGHLIFSTIHAIDALNVVTRLTNMGIDPYLISITLTLVISQRLVRRLCKFCRRQVVDSDQTHFEGRGCEHCKNKGFKGRAALFEILITATVKIEMLIRISPKARRQKAVEQGFVPIAEKAKTKIKEGIITLSDGLAF